MHPVHRFPKQLSAGLARGMEDLCDGPDGRRGCRVQEGRGGRRTSCLPKHNPIHSRPLGAGLAQIGQSCGPAEDQCAGRLGLQHRVFLRAYKAANIPWALRRQAGPPWLGCRFEYRKALRPVSGFRARGCMMRHTDFVEMTAPLWLGVLFATKAENFF